MIVVGLTGNVAAGKSALAELWRRAGVPVVSADHLARVAVQPGSPALAQVAELLGPGVIRGDGALDRGAVRRIVFRDQAARRGLEAIIHPVVRRLRDEWTEERRAAGSGIVVWEIPLLFETGMEDEVDLVVLVDAPLPVRRRRIMEARGLSREEAEAVMDSQQPGEEKLERAEIVVENGGTMDELAIRAADALLQLRSRERRARLEAAVEALLGASSVVVTTHANADGDAAGSTVALATFLRERGIDAWIVNPTPFPQAFAFLLPGSGLGAGRDGKRRRAPVQRGRPGDCCGRVGLAPHRAGEIADPAAAEGDCGPSPARDPSDRGRRLQGHRGIGCRGNDLRDDRPCRGTVDEGDRKRAVLCGDDRHGRFPLREHDRGLPAHRRATGGAGRRNRKPLHRAAYSQFHRRRYALLREALETLTVHESGRVAWMTVPRDAFDRLGATLGDLEGFVDVPRNVAGVEVAILFRTTTDDRIKVSLRSLGAEVNGIARELGGDGHARAAAAVVSGPLEEAIERVVGRVVDSVLNAGGR